MASTTFYTLTLVMVLLVVLMRTKPVFEEESFEQHPAQMVSQTIAQRLKKAINPFMDSIGKRSEYFSASPRRYFDVLAGQSLGKRSSNFLMY
uniref:Uncharacterized protein n=1 Tax=Rhabditophanes sp. KR3021 TaxID=114890 RepID=A0AC35U7J0_9BILA